MLTLRSVAEAHLYLDLRGAARTGRRASLEMRGDQLISVYEAEVEGVAKRYEFLIPAPEARSGGYGDAEPSSAISAAEFLGWSEEVARSVPADLARLSPADRAEARKRLRVAARCVDEVLKFPGVDRPRLEAVAASYRRLAADDAP